MENLVSNKEAKKQLIEHIENVNAGIIPTLSLGSTAMNSWTPTGHGIELNKLWTIAGLSGHGKTTFANYIKDKLFEANPKANFSVLYFSLENLARDILEQQLLAKMNTDIKTVYNDETISDKIEQLPENEIYFMEARTDIKKVKELTLEFYKHQVSKFGPYHGIFIVYDHSLLTAEDTNERIMLRDLANMFSEVKNSIRATVLLLSQLNDSMLATDRIVDPTGVRHYPQLGCYVIITFVSLLTERT